MTDFAAKLRFGWARALRQRMQAAIIPPCQARVRATCTGSSSWTEGLNGLSMA
jgi:spore coat protein U-like protein